MWAVYPEVPGRLVDFVLDQIMGSDLHKDIQDIGRRWPHFQPMPRMGSEQIRFYFPVPFGRCPLIKTFGFRPSADAALANCRVSYVGLGEK